MEIRVIDNIYYRIDGKWYLRHPSGYLECVEDMLADALNIHASSCAANGYKKLCVEYTLRYVEHIGGGSWYLPINDAVKRVIDSSGKRFGIDGNKLIDETIRDVSEITSKAMRLPARFKIVISEGK